MLISTARKKSLRIILYHCIYLARGKIKRKEEINMIKFTKMEGLGNDYVYIDCTKMT